MIIRPELPKDRPAIARLTAEAFGGTDEVALIDRLREANLVAASMVAEINGNIAGHILLSWLKAEFNGRPLKSLSLAPLAVLPTYQRIGIGAALVNASIRAARDLGAETIFVLGHPHYYPRFGFSPEKARKFDNPFNTDAFMALDLFPDILGTGSGFILYPAAFGLNNIEQAVRNEESAS